jgi:hypothetical protein
MRCWWSRSLSAALLAAALPVHAHKGWGVVVHERHGVVVADIPGNTIWRIRDGRAEALAEGIHSHALILGSDGAIYGSNRDPRGPAGSVWRIDGGGRLSYVIPPAAGSPLGLQSFLITADGTIHSASRYDHRDPKVELLRRSPDGSVAVAASGFSGIDGLRQEADGGILAADGAKLRRVSADGRVSDVMPALTERRFGERGAETAERAPLTAVSHTDTVPAHADHCRRPEPGLPR